MWIFPSIRTGQKNLRTSLERAIKEPTGTMPGQERKPILDAASAAQKPAQKPHEPGCKGRQAKRKTPVFAEKHEGLRHCTNVRAEGTGLEPATPVKGHLISSYRQGGLPLIPRRSFVLTGIGLRARLCFMYYAANGPRLILRVAQT